MSNERYTIELRTVESDLHKLTKRYAGRSFNQESIHELSSAIYKMLSEWFPLEDVVNDYEVEIVKGSSAPIDRDDPRRLQIHISLKKKVDLTKTT